MMGPDGKPFRTRDGESVKLMDLLDEAVKRAYDLVSQKNADEVAKGRSEPLGEEKKKAIAEAVGIGGVKYADLAQNRNSDYVFSWDKMLAMDGNTAPYMQYAYARIKSIFRKSSSRRTGVPPVTSDEEQVAGQTGETPVLQITEPAERCWPCGWCSSPRRSPPSPRTACPASCARICTIWQAISRRSTRIARCLRAKSPPAPAALPCAI